MKLIPTRTQWRGWTLPSKASYMGWVIGILAVVITAAIALITYHFDKVAGQPQLCANFTGRPYLRHKVDANDMELSYEICIQNSGNNPAIDLDYKNTTQTMVVNGRVIARAKTKNKPPRRLVSGDHYCQIFSMNNHNITKEQVTDCLKKYDSEELSIILDLEIEYVDGITGKKYSMEESNEVFRSRVMILEYPSQPVDDGI